MVKNNNHEFVPLNVTYFLDINPLFIKCRLSSKQYHISFQNYVILNPIKAMLDIILVKLQFTHLNLG